jgi:L-malate glycosyltransferase
VEDVVAVFLQVRKRVRARLLLVGDGPTRSAALALLAENDALHQVEAPGSRQDEARWLGRAHVALVPSEHESFGLAALEALACGTPVVGSRVGGLTEVVQEGRTGLLAPAGDVGAMAGAVLRLVNAPALWTTMSGAARRDAMSRFSPAQSLEGYERLYRQVCAQPPPIPLG